MQVPTQKRSFSSLVMNPSNLRTHPEVPEQLAVQLVEQLLTGESVNADEYVNAHYNLERPHQGKGNQPLPAAVQAQAPPQKPITGFKASQILRIRRCRGLISHYERIAA